MVASPGVLSVDEMLPRVEERALEKALDSFFFAFLRVFLIFTLIYFVSESRINPAFLCGGSRHDVAPMDFGCGFAHGGEVHFIVRL